MRSIFRLTRLAVVAAIVIGGFCFLSYPLLRYLFNDLSDVFEVVEAPDPGGDDMRLWHEAELHPALEPDAHGLLDPETLGEPLRFEPGRGWVGREDG